jgi:Flp pilus assembly protein TadG
MGAIAGKSLRFDLSRACGFVASLLHDRRGATAVMLAVSMTGMLGFAGLATEVGNWYKTRRALQAAADAAAFSAVVGQHFGGSITTEARAVAAKYHFLNGTNGVTVTVNQPPKSGNFVTNSTAVEVIVSQPQSLAIASLFLKTAPTITARAVAITTGAGGNCIQSLDQSSTNGVYLLTFASINATGCSVYDNARGSGSMLVTSAASITADTVTAGGTIANLGQIKPTKAPSAVANAPPAADPYANVAMPTPAGSGCTFNGYAAPPQSNPMLPIPTQLSPGTYCGGMDFPSGSMVNLRPGIYYVEGGSFHVENGATVSSDAAGVTIVLTRTPGGSNFASLNVDAGSSLQIKAPSTGSTAGIAIFGDRSSPAGQEADLGGSIAGDGGATVIIGGAVYLPTQQLYYGSIGSNTSTCTALVAYDIRMNPSSVLRTTCTPSQLPTTGPFAKLVE